MIFHYLWILILIFVVVENDANYEIASLGDICSPPFVPCATPNSECMHTDNIFYDRQNFCVCMTGFEPSTGHCISNRNDDDETTTVMTTTTAKPSNDAGNSSDSDALYDNSTAPDDRQKAKQAAVTKLPISPATKRPAGGASRTWPGSRFGKSKLPSNSPIYEPPFPEVTTSSAMLASDDSDTSVVDTHLLPSPADAFQFLRLNPYPDSRVNNMMSQHAPTRPPTQISAPWRTTSRNIAPEVMAAVTSMSLYDFKTITESPYNMQPPPQLSAQQFRNLIDPTPFFASSSSSSSAAAPLSHDKAKESGGVNINGIKRPDSHMSLDHLLNHENQTRKYYNSSMSKNAESRQLLSKFYKNRYPNPSSLAAARLVGNAVAPEFDMPVAATTSSSSSNLRSSQNLDSRNDKENSIYAMLKNAAPNIFKLVESMNSSLLNNNNRNLEQSTGIVNHHASPATPTSQMVRNNDSPKAGGPKNKKPSMIVDSSRHDAATDKSGRPPNLDRYNIKFPLRKTSNGGSSSSDESGHSSTRRPHSRKPYIFKIVSGNTSAAIKKPRIIFHG